MNNDWITFLTNHILLIAILSCIYMIPLTIIYFSINKWGKKKIAFSKIIFVLVGLIILSYLSVTVWALLVEIKLKH